MAVAYQAPPIDVALEARQSCTNVRAKLFRCEEERSPKATTECYLDRAFCYHGDGELRAARKAYNDIIAPTRRDAAITEQEREQIQRVIRILDDGIPKLRVERFPTDAKAADHVAVRVNGEKATPNCDDDECVIDLDLGRYEVRLERKEGRMRTLRGEGKWGVTSPPRPEPPLRLDVESWGPGLRVRLEADSQVPPKLAIDGTVQTWNQAVHVEPGAHIVSVCVSDCKRDDVSWSASVPVGPEELVDLGVLRFCPPGERCSPDLKPHSDWRLPVAVGVTGAALIATAVTAVLFSGAASDAEASEQLHQDAESEGLPTTSVLAARDVAAKDAQRRDTLETTMWIGVGATLISGAITTVLWLTSGREEVPAAAAARRAETRALTVQPARAGAAVALRF